MDLETGLFHDDPEFDDVVDRLSNDLFQINSINGQVSELLRRSQKQAGGGEIVTPSTDQQMTLVQQNQQLFRRLKHEIEEMQQWRDPSASQKYSQHKIAADFGRLFVEFKRIQELVLEHAKSPSNAKPNLSSSNSAQSTIELDGRSRANQFEPYDDERQEQSQSQIQEPEESDFAGQLDQVTAFEDQLAQDEVAYQQGLVADREQEIENIAQGMNELNEIYMNLGTIVREQGVSLDNIEANMHSVVTNVRNGDTQLTKAHRWQRRSTGRMCYFLVILLVLMLFIVISISL